MIQFFPRMFWRNRVTGETGSWPYTGQSPESMIAEARCYSEHTEIDYLLVEISPDHPLCS